MIRIIVSSFKKNSHPLVLRKLEIQKQKKDHKKEHKFHYRHAPSVPTLHRSEGSCDWHEVVPFISIVINNTPRATVIVYYYWRKGIIVARNKREARNSSVLFRIEWTIQLSCLFFGYNWGRVYLFRISVFSILLCY